MVKKRLTIAMSAVLLALVAVVILAMRHGPGAESTTPPAGTATSTESHTTPTPTACPTFPDAHPGIPLIAPAADWIERGFVTLPMSPAGPHSVSVSGPTIAADGEPLACFAPTPTGALFAAVASGADALDPRTLGAWARDRVVGPGRQAAIEAAASIATTATTDGRQAQIRAFRVDDCTGSRCVVQLAFDVALVDGTVQTGVGTAVMVWVRGDWRYFDDGVPDQPRYADLTALEREGFILWSP